MVNAGRMEADVRNHMGNGAIEMISTRLTRYTSTIIVCVLLLGGFAPASAASAKEIPDDVREDFLALNFSSQIPGMAQHFAGDPEYYEVWQKADLLVNDLSAEEAMMVCTLKDPANGNKISAAMTAVAVGAFRDIYGTMPRDGVDLMKFTASRYLSKAGWSEFSRLSIDKQLQAAYVGINPVTGKFYDSFTKPGWSKYGMRIRKCYGPGSTEIRLIPQFDQKTKTEINVMTNVQAWETIVFGETEGRMILRWRTWQISDNTGEPVKQPAGCPGSSAK
jgi:hypothetical protein